MKLIPGSLIVLEGIDAAGKSTQAAYLEEQFPEDLVIHSPSGTSAVGWRIYELTENEPRLNPMSRQFLHLASHCEMYDRDIVPALHARGVIMDRNWWSTVAYGWSAAELHMYLQYPDLIDLARVPTLGTVVAHTFCFLRAYKEDPHNTRELMDAYIRLIRDTHPSQVTVLAAEETADVVNAQIIRTLEGLGLVQ